MTFNFLAISFGTDFLSVNSLPVLVFLFLFFFFFFPLLSITFDFIVCGFPEWLQWKRICLPMQETQEMPVWTLSHLWRRRWQPTPVFVPGKCHGQRNLASYSPCSRKELDMTEDTFLHIMYKVETEFTCLDPTFTYWFPFSIFPNMSTLQFW